MKMCTKTAKEHAQVGKIHMGINGVFKEMLEKVKKPLYNNTATVVNLSLIHISEPTRLL